MLPPCWTQQAHEASWPAPVEVRTGSITALPYVSGTFDAVWCANVTEYLTDDELRQMLAEFRRVVRPGGMVAIKEWDNTGQLLLPGPPLLLIHLDEALLRAGDTWAHGLFRVVEIPQWRRAAGFRVTCAAKNGAGREVGLTSRRRWLRMAPFA